MESKMRPVIREEGEFFLELLNSHMSRFSTIPFFFVENCDMVDYIVEEGHSNSEIESKMLLERFCSFEPKHITQDWYLTWEPIKEIWVFRKIPGEQEFEQQRNAADRVLLDALKQFLYQISPRQFELLIFELFRAMGEYRDPLSRPQSRDGGVDMCVRFQDPVTGSEDWILVQIKHEKRALSVTHTREFIGVMDVNSRRFKSRRIRGIIISLLPASIASERAAEESSHSIDFLSADDIVRLMVKYQVGCKERDFTSLSIDTAFFEDYVEV